MVPTAKAAGLAWEGLPLIDTNRYGFALRFRLSQRCRIFSGSGDVTVPLRGFAPLRLAPVDTDLALDDAVDLELSGRGYESPELATQIGVRAAKALPYCCLTFGIGMEYADSFGVSAGVTRGQARTQEGLVVFVDDEPTFFWSVSSTLTTGPSGDDWANELGWLLTTVGDIQLPARLSDAMEFFHLSRFAHSSRSRFLLLFNALECLAASADRPADELAAVSALIKHLETMQLAPDSRDRLRSALGTLRRTSLAQRCEALVARFLGAQAAARIHTHLRLRHRLVHGAPDTVDLAHEIPELESTVCELVKKSAQRILGEQAGAAM